MWAGWSLSAIQSSVVIKKREKKTYKGSRRIASRALVVDLLLTVVVCTVVDSLRCKEGGVENTLYLLIVVVLGRLDVLWRWGKVSKKHERANNKLFVCG
jgi:hypothetical protein